MTMSVPTSMERQNMSVCVFVFVCDCDFQPANPLLLLRVNTGALNIMFSYMYAPQCLSCEHRHLRSSHFGSLHLLFTLCICMRDMGRWAGWGSEG